MAVARGTGQHPSSSKNEREIFLLKTVWAISLAPVSDCKLLNGLSLGHGNKDMSLSGG